MGTGVDSGQGGPSLPPYPDHPPRPAHPPAIPRTHLGGAAVRARGARTSAAAGLCMALGFGLLGGAAAGHWLSGDPAAAQPAEDRVVRSYAEAREVWHSVPVDSLFPRTLGGTGAGPGGADRTWVRIGVAPDSGCDGAFDPGLARFLAPAGCVRLLRATYTDVTESDVVTVGVLVTQADAPTMSALSTRFNVQGLGANSALMPRPVPFPGTDSAGFGPAQRASWSMEFPEDLPAVVYAVSGFADGRAVGDPQPASAATADGATSAPAQAGLGHDAQGLASAVQGRLTSAVDELRRSTAGAAR